MIFLILIRVGMCECLVLMRANLVCNHNRPQAGHLHHTAHTWPHTSSVCWKLNSIATSAAIISKAKKRREKCVSEEGKEKCVDRPKKWKTSGLLMCWPTSKKWCQRSPHEIKHCEDLDWMFMFDSEKLEDNSGQDGWWHSWLQNPSSHVGHLLA